MNQALHRALGTPLLEERADAKWGGDADYEEYKASTPVLVPRPGPRPSSGLAVARKGEFKPPTA